MTGHSHELITEIHTALDNLDKISAWLRQAEDLIAKDQYDDAETQISAYISWEITDLNYWLAKIIEQLEQKSSDA